MRQLLPILFSLPLLSITEAQHQEPSLVDRLLRPNMELQNSAQDKKFTPPSTIVERRGTVGTFYLPPNRNEKSFPNDRQVSARQATSRAYNSGGREIVVSQNSSASRVVRTGNSAVVDPRPAHDAGNSVTGRDFADQSQFKGQGKSQKSLDRQNPPPTIDQVRELLNKNK